MRRPPPYRSPHPQVKWDWNELNRPGMGGRAITAAKQAANASDTGIPIWGSALKSVMGGVMGGQAGGATDVYPDQMGTGQQAMSPYGNGQQAMFPAQQPYQQYDQTAMNQFLARYRMMANRRY